MDSYFPVLNLLFMENYHLSIHMAFWKESMINRLSNLINRNRSAAKISQVLCSNINTLIFSVYLIHYPSFLYIYRGMIKNYTKSFDFLHIHYKKVWFIMQKCRKTLQNCELRNVSKFPSDQVSLNTFQQLASVQSISFSQ